MEFVRENIRQMLIDFESYDVDKDLDYIMTEGIGNRIHGIYRDTYDVGKEYAVDVAGIPDWLDDDRYVNFEHIGEDEVKHDGWIALPSGGYAHIC